MENYNISKEQILSLYDNAIKDNSDIIEIDLKEYFPDAFKKELEVGKWYKILNLSNYLLNYQGEIDKDIHYGFCMGNWDNYFFDILQKENSVEATPQEVETALIAEAKKRGYKKGEWCKFGNSGMIRKLDSDYIRWVEDWGGIGIGGLSMGDNIIFSDGEWAEIVTKNIKEITMHKAVKILSKKYGKKVIIK